MTTTFSKTDAVKLRAKIQASARKMRPFRETMKVLVTELAGHNYGENASSRRVPLNLVELTSEIYIDALAANAPAALVTTAYTQLKPQASTLELALNHLINEIRLKDTLQDVLQEAMFGMGVVKIGIGDGPSTFVHNDTVYNVGQPFVELVQFEDFIVDMAATRWQDIRYAGHRYRIGLDRLRDSGRYSEEVLDGLETKGRSIKTAEGDESVRALSGDAYAGTEDEMEVELIDVWLPDEKVIVTMEFEGSSAPLHVIEWQGPEAGPFEVLWFRKVPGNIIPLPPGTAWLDNHDLLNRLFRKLGDQAERQKTIMTVSPQHAKYGQRIVEAQDGDCIAVKPGSDAKEHNLGGMDQTTFAFALQLKQLHSYFAGNLDALGGLAAMSETASQDAMLMQNASQRVQRMQAGMYDFVHRVLKQLAWYLWTDPFIEIPLVKRIGSMQIPIKFTPEQREGDFLDYNFTIEPYSMQPKTPEARMQSVMSILTQVLIPALPMIQQQGGNLSWQAIMEVMSRYGRMPELNDIIQWQTPLMLQQQGPVQPPQGGAQAAATKRVYERRNVPQRSDKGAEQVLMQTLLGGTAQPSERANLARG